MERRQNSSILKVIWHIGTSTKESWVLGANNALRLDHSARTELGRQMLSEFKYCATDQLITKRSKIIFNQLQQ